MGHRQSFQSHVTIDATSKDVRQSVERSIRKLPRLARLNPKAALVVERHIDDWMPPASPGDRDDVVKASPLTLLKGPRLPRRVFAHPAIATGRRKAAS